MPDMLVRDLDERTVARLKARARTNHRSLQSEVKSILDHEASTPSKAEFAARVRSLKALHSDMPLLDSTPLVRADRER